MARILAIDFGLKRVGLAVTDPMQIIASGLTTVENKNAVKFIVDYCTKEEVESLVIGEPKTLDNREAELEADIRKFIQKLENQLNGIVIHRVDERFTSSIAQRSLIDSGVKKSQRRKKELLDEVSATLILQSYLESRT